MQNWDDFVEDKLKQYNIQKGSHFESQLYLAYEETMQIFLNAEYTYKNKIKDLEEEVRKGESALLRHIQSPHTRIPVGCDEVK